MNARLGMKLKASPLDKPNTTYVTSDSQELNILDILAEQHKACLSERRAERPVMVEATTLTDRT